MLGHDARYILSRHAELTAQLGVALYALGVPGGQAAALETEARDLLLRIQKARSAAVEAVQNAVRGAA